MVKPPPPPPPRNENGDGRFASTPGNWPRMLLWLGLFGALALIIVPFNSPDQGDEITFGQLLAEVEAGNVSEIEYNNINKRIEGEFRAATETSDGTELAAGPFTSTGPPELTESDRAILAADPDL